MATLDELIARGVLSAEVDTAPGSRPPHRTLLLTRNFLEKRRVWASARSNKGGRLSIPEQYYLFLNRFLAGKRISYGPLKHDLGFHPLEPHAREVVEFKTSHLRIFGWFFQRDVYIAHDGRLKDTLSRLDYERQRENTAHYRDVLLGLDEPRSIPGDNADDFLTIQS